MTTWRWRMASPWVHIVRLLSQPCSPTLGDTPGCWRARLCQVACGRVCLGGKTLGEASRTPQQSPRCATDVAHVPLTCRLQIAVDAGHTAMLTLHHCTQGRAGAARCMPSLGMLGCHRRLAQGLRADRPAREMGHDTFGKFGQLLLKHLSWHAHDGSQVDALEAGVLLLDTPQVVHDLLGGPA